MVQDLFEKTLTDKDRLWNWLKTKGYVRTSEIIKWGTENFSNRADRNARVLAEEGKLVRMDKQKKLRYFGNIREEVYEVNNVLS